jgi:hypothetical protein
MKLLAPSKETAPQLSTKCISQARSRRKLARRYARSRGRHARQRPVGSRQRTDIIG